MSDASLSPGARPDNIAVATRVYITGTENPGNDPTPFTADLVAVAPQSGMYRVSVYTKTYGGGTLTLTLGWTDNLGAQNKVMASGDTLIVWALAGHGITANCSIAGVGASFEALAILEPL